MLCVVRVCLQGCVRYVNPRHCICSCSGERAVDIFHSGWGMCVCVYSDCVGMCGKHVDSVPEWVTSMR